MDDQDRMSQASSTATISYMPVTKEGEAKLQAFGKRCQAAKRDPNCPVVIRGWLNKKDSKGLKLWKRRWFVLSNYCLFYYKDSREESVLGSIPLPSYKIVFCTPQECKNQKFTFKVTHQGMRSYFFSADTQEDLLGWVRALSQSATMESATSINRRCSSYQDFTRIDYGESIDFSKKTPDGIGHSQKHKLVRTLTNLSQLTVGQRGASQWARERLHHRHRSHLNGTWTTPTGHRWTCGYNPEEDCLYDHNTPPVHREMIGAEFLSTRSQPESWAHTPMGRVDIRPNDDLDVAPQSLYYTLPSPKREFRSAPTTPLSERWQNISKCPTTYAPVHYQSNGRKPLAKTLKHDLGETATIRPYESDADIALTRLCGCDRMLQELSAKLGQLQMDKECAQCALEVCRLQLHEWQERGPNTQEESLVSDKSLLQEELVTVRARMCDVLLEMDLVWGQYERLESELCVIRSHLEHISNFGHGQEQTQAQKVLWIMDDILGALKVNRDHFYFLLVVQRPHVLQSTWTHSGFTGQHMETLGTALTMDMERTSHVRHALPQEMEDNHQHWDYSHVLTESPYEKFHSSKVEPAQIRGRNQSQLHVVKPRRNAESNPGTKCNRQDIINQSMKMKMRQDEDKHKEKIRANPENLGSWKKPPLPTVYAQSRASETEEKEPFPLRVTRVVTSVLPTSLVARRVSVEDPPAEFDNPLYGKISQPRPSELPQNTQCVPGIPVRNQNLIEGTWNQPNNKEGRQHGGVLRSSKKQISGQNLSQPDTTEFFKNQAQDPSGVGNGSSSLDKMEEEQYLAFLTSNIELELIPEKRNAKLRRVEQIRGRFLQSAGRGSCATSKQVSQEGEMKVHHTFPNTTKKEKVESEHGNEQSKTYSDCNDKEGGNCAHPSFFEETSQNRNDRNGLVKSIKKLKHPSSPEQSSMMVYQKGGTKFVHVKDEEKSSKGEDESSFSSDLKAKWFLSTNNCQDTVPVLTDNLGSLCNDDTTDVKQHLDDTTYSSELLSTVHESLEKMRKNHSLFYKIACDISISDSDITKCDENSYGQMSFSPKEEEELPITKSDNATCNTESSTQQPGLPQYLNNSYTSETCCIEKKCKDHSKQSSQLEVNGTNFGVDADESVQETDAWKKEQKRSDLLKGLTSVEERAVSTVQELDTNNSIFTKCSSVPGLESVNQRDSFEKARVTVLRTSL